ncbi:MAG: MBL fold metallo-hydrolase [Ilumatobacteraceae bacterium]
MTFWGAAGTVTGSRHLVESAGRRILIDCGLFQGHKLLRQRNWDSFPVEPKSIDAVVLTHAHIDHSGWLPRLVRDGFAGKIWCTPSTLELCRIMLPDSAHLQEEEARYANKRRSSRHNPALPLYTAADADRALLHLHAHPFGESFSPAPGLRAEFSPTGHILGAACVRIADERTSVLFTGDVGRPVDPIMRPPAPPLSASYVVTESTYGNRVHDTTDPIKELADIVNRTIRRGGTLLVPVFAVGRAQTVLYLLSRLNATNQIPKVPIYMNSPMAVNTTELFCRHLDEHRLNEQECKEMCQDVNFVRTVEESKRLTSMTGPMIVLSASGMLTGGRVLHHLEQLAPDHRNTVLLVGYQAAGTRGAALRDGATSLKMYGKNVSVKAEVARMDGLSAHADANELIAWLASMPEQPKGASVVHGEADAADAFRLRLQDELGWTAQVPMHGDSIEIG